MSYSRPGIAPTEPPVVYMTLARYDELRRQAEEMAQLPTAVDGQHPPQAECEHDWIADRFEEKPYNMRVCRWCGLGEARNTKDEPWEFFTQMHGASLSARPPLRGTS